MAMNSDDLYFNDELDSVFLNEVDTIEGTARASPATSTAHIMATPAEPPQRIDSPALSVIEIEDSDPFDAFDFDVAELQDIQEGRREQLAAGPSKRTLHCTTSRGTIQTTLLGGVVPQSPKGKLKSSSRAPMQRSHSRNQTSVAEQTRKTKLWNHTAFAKSGWKQSVADKAKKKGKGRASFEDAEGEEEEEERVEFEQFPAPFMPVGPPPPMRLKPDLLAARHWTYPLNNPKRDYQFNIARHCLFDNTLVALPTGLGKTFIAGVVMLNFFNWFPEGKVVFLAPTKPLVNQQIEASHKVCGIPGSHAAELTGEVSRTKRLCLWAEKRVFYMTPQTLMSDLISKTCDPSEIILIVFDEAHKGRGDFAYAQIVRLMMAKNPHFRVLALSATPGGKPEVVQDVVDCLHISHIEIRDEDSLDIRSYVYKKEVVTHKIQMDEAIIKIRDLLVKIMQPMIKTVQSNGVLAGSSDPVMLHSFRCQTAMGEVRGKKAPHWVFGTLGRLVPLARAMGYLLESSTSMCYNALVSRIDEQSGERSASKSLQKDPRFQALLREVEDQKNCGFSLHPKMEKLRVLLVQHFAKHMFDRQDATDNEQDAGKENSRVMVFASFRECVDEIVDVLSKEAPLIRATRFIGQATDKHGKAGLAQREQLDVIKRFKRGEFNVLVSTSIGEEGLDIGEVDMIICYDAQKTPIRMLQRAGRTGRKKDGVVHVLLAEGREERNLEKAKQSQRGVQDFIVHAEHLELYGDVERLLPEHVKPECVERVMEIEEYVRDEKPSRKGSRVDGGDSPISKGKRKRDDDPLRNIPNGASTGFVNVKDLLVKGAAKGKKRRKTEADPDKFTGEDDDDDLEIEAGIFGSRRTASTSTLSRGPKPKKPRRAKTIATADGRKASKQGEKAVAPQKLTHSQIEKMAAEDSDDAEIERGLASSHVDQSPPPSPTVGSRASSICDSHRRRLKRIVSPKADADHSVIDLTTPSQPLRAGSPAISLSSSPDQPLFSNKVALGGNRAVCSLSPAEILGSSPDRPLKSLNSRSTSSSSRTLQSRDPSTPPGSPSNCFRSATAPSKVFEADMAWLLDGDGDEEPGFGARGSPLPAQRKSSSSTLVSDDELDLLRKYSSSPEVRERSPVPSRLSSGSATAKRGTMLPLALPARVTMLPPPRDENVMPEPTFAVRAPGKQGKKRTVADALDSSPLAMPPPSQRRLQRRDSSSPQPVPAARKSRKRKFKDIAEAQKANPFIDVEATHSGDERSGGSSDAEHEEGYEPSFVQDVPATQVSPSYDQSAVYRRSLLTQAPGGCAGPVFANRPIRRAACGGGRSVSESRDNFNSPRYDEDDEYEFGSFVVADDADISLAGQSSSEP